MGAFRPQRKGEEMKKGGNKMKYKIRETVDLIIRSSAGLLSKDSVQSLMMFVAQFVSQENMDTQEPLEIKRKILKEYRIYLNWVTNNLIYFEPYQMGKETYIVDVNQPRHIFIEQPKTTLGRLSFENKIS